MNRFAESTSKLPLKVVAFDSRSFAWDFHSYPDVMNENCSQCP